MTKEIIPNSTRWARANRLRHNAQSLKSYYKNHDQNLLRNKLWRRKNSEAVNLSDRLRISVARAREILAKIEAHKKTKGLEHVPTINSRPRT